MIRTPTKTHKLRALTMIDPATGWFEIKDLQAVDSGTVMEAFHNEWLCRYPQPTYVGFDNGSEFKKLFKEMCDNYGLETKRSTAYNPQGNSMIERIHQVLQNALLSFKMEELELDDHDPWSPFLSSAAWAIRSTVHTTLEASPGQLVYGRDMLLPVQFKADWARIRQRKQESITRSNERENQKRIPHRYSVGDKVLIDKPGIKRKMSRPRAGPFLVTAVYTNGTVRVQRGAVSERLNVRRLTPYAARSN